MKKGLQYKSISQKAKNSIKFLINFILKFENRAIKFARQKNCDGIICGHVHNASIKKIDDIIYMNSGDWVESMSALAEDNDGNWSLVYYADTSGFKSNHKKIAKINLDEDASIETEEINLRKKTA
jgi:UDP-2,3-diacylglucosamine pyrophosphatase LpxH